MDEHHKINLFEDGKAKKRSTEGSFFFFSLNVTNQRLPKQITDGLRWTNNIHYPLKLELSEEVSKKFSESSRNQKHPKEHQTDPNRVLHRSVRLPAMARADLRPHGCPAARPR